MTGKEIKSMSFKDIYTGEYPPFDNNDIGYAVREEDIKGKLKDKEPKFILYCTGTKATIETTVDESQGKGGKGDPIRYKIEKTADN